MKIQKNKKQRGFTLVEALISVTILMISVAAPLSVASSGLIGAKIAERQIIASYLAQDAIEYVVNIKAGNKIGNYNNNFGVMAGLVKCQFGGSNQHGCFVDTIKNDIKTCLNTSCNESELKMDLNKGLYVYGDGIGLDNSGFKRIVKIKPERSQDSEIYELIVTVDVQWQMFGETQRYSLTNHLTSW